MTVSSDISQAHQPSASIALTGEPTLQLFRVMSPWHSGDASQGTFEETVWTTDTQSACYELACRMANSSTDEECKTEEGMQQWVDDHMENVGHLMVVIPVLGDCEADIRSLMMGPDRNNSKSVQADIAAVMAILNKYTKA